MEALKLEPPYLVIRPGVTEEEFYRLAGEDSDWEYLDGRLVMHSPASRDHEDLFSFLMTLFRGYLDERGGARVLGSRFPMRLDEHWSTEPDLMVVREEGYDRLTARRLEGPAHLVVEIASESDPGLDRREKLPRYREAGIDEIWLLDPFAHQIQADTRTGDGYQSRTLASGRLAATALPGFWLDVTWLWQEKRPSTLACLRQILGES